jgi:hypothetical protein
MVRAVAARKVTVAKIVVEEWYGDLRKRALICQRFGVAWTQKVYLQVTVINCT